MAARSPDHQGNGGQGGDGNGKLGGSDSNPRLRPNTKLARVLRAFLTGRSFNRFEATWELSDWCLHSTVSGLQRYGLTIARRDEVVVGFEGAKTHVCRYWLPVTEHERARRLLGGVR